jgi:hypothetical protein
MIALWPLGLGIYALTIYYAYLGSVWAALASAVLPLLSQLYWIWQIWSTTGEFCNVLTLTCLLWVALATLGMVLFAAADTYAIPSGKIYVKA